MAIFLTEDILQAARALRPYLFYMIDDKTEADEIGRQLDKLLHQAQDGEKVDNHILELFTRRRETREWLKKALKPHDQDSTLKNYTPPPGPPPPVPATQKFACPVKDCTFIWVRRYATQPVPPCPQHGHPIQPAP